MTSLQDETLPTSLTDMLPVGMIASGGAAAAAMALVAQRKRSQDGWEAFHYERISPTEFDITGGIAVHSATATQGKRWQEPHEAVSVSETEVLQELQQMRLRASPAPTAQQTLPETSNAATTVPHAEKELSAVPALAVGAQQYLQIVLALPDDEAGRQRILQAFQLQADFFGAQVKACSIHDVHPIAIR